MGRPQYLGTSIIWAACLQHLSWAILLLIGDPTTATPVHWLAGFCPNRIVLAVVLAAVSIAAMLHLVSRKMHTCRSIVWHVVPQQFVMLLSMAGAIWAVCQGQYADGTVVSRVHLMADQDVYIFTAILHTLAVRELWIECGRWSIASAVV